MRMILSMCFTADRGKTKFVKSKLKYFTETVKLQIFVKN